MTSPETPVTLTPQQAATGVVVTVPVSTGTARLRIPPARDGDLVRAPLGDTEVLLRVRVSPGGARRRPLPRPVPPEPRGACWCWASPRP